MQPMVAPEIFQIGSGIDKARAAMSIINLVGNSSEPNHCISQLIAIKIHASTVAKQIHRDPISSKGLSTIGLKTKINGTIKATTEKRIEMTAIWSGFAPDIAPAAYAATATGGVIADITAK